MRNRIAKLLLSLANRMATSKTLCSTKEGWQFKREWFAEPYNFESKQGE